MTYLATSINDSAVITEKAGAALDDVRGKAVKYDASGNVVLCSTAGEAAIGIGIMTNDEATAQGADVDIQVKEMGLVRTGDAVSKGDELTCDTNGGPGESHHGRPVYHRRGTGGRRCRRCLYQGPDGEIPQGCGLIDKGGTT